MLGEKRARHQSLMNAGRSGRSQDDENCEANVVAIIQPGRRMAFISMYNSQEGVAFSDVQVKSCAAARRGAVPGRGGASQWEESCARRELSCRRGEGQAGRPHTPCSYLLHICVWLGTV